MSERCPHKVGECPRSFFPANGYSVCIGRRHREGLCPQQGLGMAERNIDWSDAVR